MKKEKFGKVAMGQVQQSKVVTSTDLTGVSNRVAVLEGYNLDARLDVLEGQTLDARIDTLESQVATLMSQMATMLTHKHNYDDSGVAEQTSTPV
jgi:hypothetical protein